MKWLKYILTGIFGLLLLLFITVAAIVIFQGDVIKGKVVEAVNEHVNTPIYIKQGIDIEFWSHFPNITVRFNEIEVRESIDFTERNMLEAERLEFVLNIWDLIRGNYVVRQLIFFEGKLHLESFKDGSTNFNILKAAQEDGQAESDFELNVQSAVFKNIHFYYKDHNNHLITDLQVHSAEIIAAFNQYSFSAITSIDAYANQIASGEHVFFKEKNLGFAGNLDLDFKDNIYAFNEIDLKVESLHILTSGTLTHQKVPELNFVFESKETDFAGLKELIPHVQNDLFEQISGRFTLNGELKGKLSEQAIPEIKCSFNIIDATFQHHSELKQVKNIHLKGNFNSGTSPDLSKMLLNIPEISFTIDQADFNGDLRLENLTDPYMQTGLNGSFPLSMIHLFVPDQYVQLTGIADLQNLQIVFYPKRLIENKAGSVQQFGGKIDLTKAQIKNQHKRMFIPKASVSFENQKITIHHLTVQDDIQEWSASGYIQHLYEYVAGVTQKTVPASIPYVQLDVDGKRLDLEAFIAFFDFEKTQVKADTDINALPTLYDLAQFNGKANLKFNSVYYDQIKGEQFSGSVAFLQGSWTVEQFRFNNSEGRFNGKGKISIMQSDNIDIEGSFSAAEVNMQALFENCWNFGQDFITDSHLSGKLNTNVVIGNYWRNGEYDLNRLSVIADIRLEDGHLHNFEPLEVLSSYIQAEELKNIQFSKLENRIEIGDSRIFIPGMHIVSNAFVIQLEGIHTFENIIDYNLKVNLSHLLAGRHRNRNISRAYWEDNPDGSMNLFLSMKGNADNPQISYNTVAARQQVRQSFQNQGEQVRRAFDGSLDDYDRGRESRDWETDEPAEFLDWD